MSSQEEGENMGIFEKAAIDKPTAQQLAIIVAKYIKAYPQPTAVVAPEIHRDAYNLAVEIASKYLQESEETLQAMDLATDLLDLAYELLRNVHGVPMADDDEPIPAMWSRSFR